MKAANSMKIRMESRHREIIEMQIKEINNDRLKKMLLLIFGVLFILIWFFYLPEIRIGKNVERNILYLKLNIIMLTVIAVETYVSKRFEKNQNSKIYDYLYSVGLYNNGGVYGTNGASFVTAGRQYGLQCDYIGSYDSFVSALSQGKLVAMQVVGSPFVTPGASHAMVIYGYESGAVNVIDPMNGNCSGRYSAEDIWNHRTDVPTDLDQGVAGFAF